MRALVLSAVVLFTGCGGLLQVQVEIERLCVTRGDALSIPALPTGGALSVSGAISAPAGGALDLELRFDSLELRNPRGAADFAFLGDAALYDDGRAVPIPVASLRRSGAGEPPSVRLEAAPAPEGTAPGDDRFDYLLSVVVNALAAPVTADLEVCARVHGRYAAL